jgi:hypothetical protein
MYNKDYSKQCYNNNYNYKYNDKYNNFNNNNIYKEYKNNINNSIFNDLNENKNKNNENIDNHNDNDLDQALSLNDKFVFKDIELEENNRNNLFCYVPEENIQGLYSINIELSNKNVKFKYLKHFLGNKRNNNDNIYQPFENNNNINIEPNNIIEQNNNIIDNIFKTIFKNRKNFYGNADIKKIWIKIIIQNLLRI